MSSVKLKNAPLKEVIFELHWECSTDNAGSLFDKGFDLAQGKFAEKVMPVFPVHKKLIPDGSPFKIFGIPLHQYWTGELKWPVVQHGQGMIAVNDVEEGYVWADSFKPMIINAIQNIMDSYVEPLKFNKAKLVYVDACDIDEKSPIDFMVANLQTSITTNYPLPGSLTSFNIQQTFELADHSTMIINISNGINNATQKESVIWTTNIEKQALMDFEEIVDWIETAHKATSDIFKKMLNPSFYASLDS